MQRPERKIQDKVKEYAIASGWHWFKRSTASPYQSNGQPDGEFTRKFQEIFFIEFKAPGNKSTPLQRERQEELARMGFPVYECDSVEYGKEIVNFHTKMGTTVVYKPRNSHAR